METTRLLLRRWQPKDSAPFAQMNQDADVMRFFPSLPTPEQSQAMIERVERHFDEKGFGWWVVEHKESGDFMGFTGLITVPFESFFTPCVEIGWRFRKEYWKQGYAQEAALVCLRFGFEELKLDSIFSFTAVVNTPSEKVMQRIGMTKVTEFGHPRIDKDHWLHQHVLYKKAR